MIRMRRRQARARTLRLDAWPATVQSWLAIRNRRTIALAAICRAALLATEGTQLLPIITFRAGLLPAALRTKHRNDW